jgi:large subunit ribosomal protein L27e
MVKFLKAGKVVIVTHGRFAGKKAVILRTYDEKEKPDQAQKGAKSKKTKVKRKYPHALIAGIERYPLKVTKSMRRQKVNRRSRIKPFVKVINYNHFMPTRYNFDLDIKSILKEQEKIDLTPARRAKLRRLLKSIFQKRYVAGTNKWFFTKLRF